MSWKDIQLLFLPALKKTTGRDYRLPTEAEWEYAAHGGFSSSHAQTCRIASCNGHDPVYRSVNIGFRLVLQPVG